MKKIVRLTENDLVRLVKKVINEQNSGITNLESCLAKKFTRKQIEERMSQLLLNLQGNGYTMSSEPNIQKALGYQGNYPKELESRKSQIATSWPGLRLGNGPFIMCKVDGDKVKLVWLEKRWTDTCPVVYSSVVVKGLGSGGDYSHKFIMDDSQFNTLLQNA